MPWRPEHDDPAFAIAGRRNHLAKILHEGIRATARSRVRRPAVSDLAIHGLFAAHIDDHQMVAPGLALFDELYAGAHRRNEAMDAEYVVEQMIRDRLADARTSARWAVVLRQSKERSRRPNRIRSWLIDVGPSLVNGAREGAFGISRLLRSRKPITKRS